VNPGWQFLDARLVEEIVIAGFHRVQELSQSLVALNEREIFTEQLARWFDDEKTWSQDRILRSSVTGTPSATIRCQLVSATPPNPRVGVSTLASRLPHENRAM
jgi:hypothetical protein